MPPPPCTPPTTLPLLRARRRPSPPTPTPSMTGTPHTSTPQQAPCPIHTIPAMGPSITSITTTSLKVLCPPPLPTPTLILPLPLLLFLTPSPTPSTLPTPPLPPSLPTLPPKPLAIPGPPIPALAFPLLLPPQHCTTHRASSVACLPTAPTTSLPTPLLSAGPSFRSSMVPPPPPPTTMPPFLRTLTAGWLMPTQHPVLLEPRSMEPPHLPLVPPSLTCSTPALQHPLCLLSRPVTAWAAGGGARGNGTEFHLPCTPPPTTLPQRLPAPATRAMPCSAWTPAAVAGCRCKTQPHTLSLHQEEEQVGHQQRQDG